jgi:hypothetical protein
VCGTATRRDGRDRGAGIEGPGSRGREHGRHGVVTQTQGLAAAKPADSPVAGPVKKFPQGIAGPDQDRLRAAVLAAITNGMQAETDRYIANAGQALGDTIGQLTISRLSAHAKEELCAAFDLRLFHDEVLSAGALPLDFSRSASTRGCPPQGRDGRDALTITPGCDDGSARLDQAAARLAGSLRCPVRDVRARSH